MKTDQEPKIRVMLKEAKESVAMFDEIVSNLAEEEIKNYSFADGYKKTIEEYFKKVK